MRLALHQRMKSRPEQIRVPRSGASLVTKPKTRTWLGGKGREGGTCRLAMSWEAGEPCHAVLKCFMHLSPAVLWDKAPTLSGAAVSGKGGKGLECPHVPGPWGF